MSRALAAALEKLLAAQGSAPATLFTPAQRRQLDIFARQTGALRLLTQGSGASYRLINAAQAQSHLTALRPNALGELDAALPARANNIARMRDSKGRSHGHATGYLLLKALSRGVVWQRDGAVFDVSAATDVAGAAAVAISVDDGWRTEQPIWLVENQALFDRPDWLPAGASGSLVYYGGQLSNLLLAWLAQRPRTASIVFFPDYDGVGLLNYSRLVENACCPVEFWLMPDWEVRLHKYGNNGLWNKTRKHFDAAIVRLGEHGMPSALGGLCRALAEHGLALEHEAVWLDVPG
ncbi:MAG: hypothetical protein V4484_19685 [Pseudomonadota bacterium]